MESRLVILASKDIKTPLGKTIVHKIVPVVAESTVVSDNLLEAEKVTELKNHEK